MKGEKKVGFIDGILDWLCWLRWLDHHGWSSIPYIRLAHTDDDANDLCHELKQRFLNGNGTKVLWIKDLETTISRSCPRFFLYQKLQLPCPGYQLQNLLMTPGFTNSIFTFSTRLKETWTKLFPRVKLFPNLWRNQMRSKQAKITF